MLSGVELTLADQAITLTLTQLPDILSVQITVRGQELAYRSKQVFTARDVLVAPEGDVVGTAEVTLYFPDESGVLQPEERTLELYEGDTQVSAVARALENGPLIELQRPLLRLQDSRLIRKIERYLRCANHVSLRGYQHIPGREHLLEMCIRDRQTSDGTPTAEVNAIYFRQQEDLS